MTTDMKNTVLSCPICIEHRNANAKEPMQSSDIPDQPWQIAATGIFHWHNVDYINYYSRSLEVRSLLDMKPHTVIDTLES